MEKKIDITTDIGLLEGILDHGSQKQGVIITHPHPLYGGNMENTVVHTIASVYKSKGYTTLRFNFRGVDGSAGTYNEGIGEQADIEAAISYLEMLKIENIELAGYSFGSWVIHKLVNNKTIHNRIIMVSPPVDFMQFEEGTNMENLALVVAGSQDNFASADKLASLVSEWNPGAVLRIIDGADHFYSGHFSELAKMLSED